MPLSLRTSLLLAGLAAAPAAFAVWGMASTLPSQDVVLSVRVPSEADLLLRRAAAEEDASRVAPKPLGRADEIDLTERDIFLRMPIPEASKPTVTSEGGRGILMLRTRPLPNAVGDQLRVRALPEA